MVVWECRLKKDRFEKSMEEIVGEVRRAGNEARPGRVVEIGASPAWRLRRLRARHRCR